jgi:hypothetical protein
MLNTQAQLEEDSKVYWLYRVTRGPNCQKIPAIVKKVMSTRVRIEFMTWEMGEWVRNQRTISPSNVTLRQEPVALLDTPDQPQVPAMVLY